MTLTNPAQGATSMLKPLTSAIQLNLAATIMPPTAFVPMMWLLS